MNFINELINNPMFIIYFSFINFALTIIAIFTSVFCINKYKKLNLRYEKFMRKLSTGEKIEEILCEYLEDVRKLKVKDEEIGKLKAELEKSDAEPAEEQLKSQKNDEKKSWFKPRF
jgi:predicted membrane protein